MSERVYSTATTSETDQPMTTFNLEYIPTLKLYKSEDGIARQSVLFQDNPNLWIPLNNHQTIRTNELRTEFPETHLPMGNFVQSKNSMSGKDDTIRIFSVQIMADSPTFCVGLISDDFCIEGITKRKSWLTFENSKEMSDEEGVYANAWIWSVGRNKASTLFTDEKSYSVLDSVSFPREETDWISTPDNIPNKKCSFDVVLDMKEMIVSVTCGGRILGSANLDKFPDSANFRLIYGNKSSRKGSTKLQMFTTDVFQSPPSLVQMSGGAVVACLCQTQSWISTFDEYKKEELTEKLEKTLPKSVTKDIVTMVGLTRKA